MTQSLQARTGGESCSGPAISDAFVQQATKSPRRKRGWTHGIDGVLRLFHTIKLRPDLARLNMRCLQDYVHRLLL
jgi:hypothetical protein